MIDIHTHVLPFVDDGSDSLEKSIEMLKIAKSQGITDVVCTPHFRVGFYQSSVNELQSAFNDFKVNTKELGINVYLGQEISISNNISKSLLSNEKLTINNGKYALVEFDYNNYVDVGEVCYEIIIASYIPVVAHIERYSYLKLEDIINIQNLGAIIQVNADSLFKEFGNPRRRMVEKLLKGQIAQVVASDMHYSRPNRMLAAYEWVSKKVNKDYANLIFEENPRAIINNEPIKKSR